MNANLRNFALWVIIVLLLLALFTLFQNPGQRTSSTDVSFSQLLTEVDQGHVRDVIIQGPEIHGTFTNGSSFQTYAPNDPTLVKRLYDGKVQITAKPPGDNVPVSPSRYLDSNVRTPVVFWTCWAIDVRARVDWAGKSLMLFPNWPRMLSKTVVFPKPGVTV